MKMVVAQMYNCIRMEFRKCFHSHNFIISMATCVLLALSSASYSLTLFYNSTIQALVYPELADVGSLKLKPGANKTLHFFFTPSTGAVQKRVRKVEKMLTEDVFSLCVSEFPARLLIKIK